MCRSRSVRLCVRCPITRLPDLSSSELTSFPRDVLQSIPPALSHLAPLRGLDFYHHIGMLISRGLVRSPIAPTRAPQIVLEVGHDQAREVEEILLLGPAGSRVERTERWTDFAGKERVVAGWLKESGDEGGVTEVREGVGRDQK